MPAQIISPLYGLSTTRLTLGEHCWAALVLHSTTLTWPFDPETRQLADLDELAGLAAQVGLHRITNPFTTRMPGPGQPWSFRLPSPSRPARLAGPTGVLHVMRQPNITAPWWSAAVAAGGRCRLMIAACVRLADAPEPHRVLNEAAEAGRVFGATIPVEFFTPTEAQ